MPYYRTKLKDITRIWQKNITIVALASPASNTLLPQTSVFPSLSEQFFFFFFNYYLAAPRPTSGHYRGDSLTHPMLLTAFVHVRPEGHREPRSEVGSLSPAERLAGFEPGTFRFL